MGKLYLYKICNRCTTEQVLTQFSKRLCELRFVKTTECLEGVEHMALKFEDGTHLKHFERVLDVLELEDKILVKTLKKEWYFLKVPKEVNNVEDLLNVIELDLDKSATKNTRVSVCTTCGKREKHKKINSVEVYIDGEKQYKDYMLCICTNCETRYIVEV